jgi:sulfur carrier protein
MQIIINGQPTPLEKPLSVQELLHRLGYLDHFVAVAVNQECVLRRNYGTQFVQAEDQIEILAPMAGG